MLEKADFIILLHENILICIKSFYSTEVTESQISIVIINVKQNLHHNVEIHY